MCCFDLNEAWAAEGTSSIVKEKADGIDKWQGSSIVKVIEELG